VSTFYMVEMHYPETEDRAQFDAFYAKHISMLLTIDGFLSAQRYKCSHAAKAPYLAVYKLRDPAVMESENYTSKAGRSSVNPTFRAKMTNWDRNLVQGDLADMEVGADGWLVLIDRLTPDSPALPEGFTRLRVAGLDATIAERGVRIGQGGAPVDPGPAPAGWTVRSFRPIHPPRHPESSRTGGGSATRAAKEA
jgi:hypothetical protein